MTNPNTSAGTSWIGKNSSDEEWAYLALSQSIIEEHPHQIVIEDLLEKLSVDEEICYLCATDAYATTYIGVSGCSVSLIHYENTLLSFAVDSTWAVLAGSKGGFMWVITYDDLVLEQITDLPVHELLEHSQRGDIELISVAVCDSAPS